MKNRYEIRGADTAIFIEYKDEMLECLIDTNDLDVASSIKGRWFANKHHSGKYYIRGPYKGGKVMLHRLIMKPQDGLVVDHINHNPSDNRRINLRVISNSENKQNLVGARSDSGTGIRGVRYDADSKIWYVTIKVSGIEKYLGSYKTKEEAAEVIKRARSIYMPYSQEAL